MEQRVLLIDGPFRGADIPYSGSNILELPGPDDGSASLWSGRRIDEKTLKVYVYMIVPFRTQSGKLVMLGSLFGTR